MVDIQQELLILHCDLPRYVLDTVTTVAGHIDLLEPFERRQGSLYEAALLGLAMKNDIKSFPAFAARSLMRFKDVPVPPRGPIGEYVAAALQNREIPSTMKTVRYCIRRPYGEHIETDSARKKAFANEDIDLDNLLSSEPERKKSSPVSHSLQLTTDPYAHVAHGLLLGICGGTTMDFFEFSRVGESVANMRDRATIWLKRLFEESLLYRRRFKNRVKGRQLEDELLDIEAGREAIASDTELYLLCMELATEKIGMHTYEPITD